MIDRNTNPQRTGRKLYHFSTDRTSGSLAEVLAQAEPFGVRLEHLERSYVSAWIDDEGNTRIDIGDIRVWDDGITTAHARKGTNEACIRTLVEAAARAALEPDFVKGSWGRQRAKKGDPGYKYTRISAMPNLDANPEFAHLARALWFATLECPVDDSERPRVSPRENHGLTV